jgi:hypothetical protein
MSNLIEETAAFEWAVQWRPGAEVVNLGGMPPWQADYERWRSSRSLVVYRRKVVTQVFAEESAWTEVPA